jgi:transcriptional regulator with XRE-family HTH domain
MYFDGLLRDSVSMLSLASARIQPFSVIVTKMHKFRPEEAGCPMTSGDDQKRAATRSLGQAVRRRRQELGLTQEELAERIGGNMRQSDISRLERGRIDLPRRQRLEAIATALDVTPGYLLLQSHWFGEDEGKPESGYARATDEPAIPAENVSWESTAALTHVNDRATNRLNDAIARAREVARRTNELLKESSDMLSSVRPPDKQE